MKITRKCSNCDKDVVRENSKRNRSVKNVFCNHKCQGIWQRGKNNSSWNGGRIKKQCVVCEKEYTVKQSEKESKVCSQKCNGQLLILKAKEIRNCLVCDEEFVATKSRVQRYCSRECSSLAHSTRMIGTSNPNYVDGNGSSRHPVEFNKRLKRKIRERDGYFCQLCGTREEDYGKNLDVHHIDYDKTNNSEDNLIALCNSCHSTTNGNRDFWKQELSNLLNASLRED